MDRDRLLCVVLFFALVLVFTFDIVLSIRIITESLDASQLSQISNVVRVIGIIEGLLIVMLLGALTFLGVEWEN